LLSACLSTPDQQNASEARSGCKPAQESCDDDSADDDTSADDDADDDSDDDSPGADDDASHPGRGGSTAADDDTPSGTRPNTPGADDDVSVAPDDDVPLGDDDVALDDDLPADDDVTSDDDLSPGPAPAPPPANAPVNVHGQLSVSGTQLVDESGQAVQLKGISSFWLNWDDKHYAESLKGLQWMRDNWNLQVFRAAMGVDEDGAYLEDPDTALAQVRTIIDNAVKTGVYVIVDWHDHHAEMHQSESVAFFSQMAAEYGDLPNVLWETFNEPLDVDWDQVVKPYHEAVVASIRQQDPDNVIILGTPHWSQDVDVAAQNRLSGSNLMYTLHFYACTHQEETRAKGQVALDSGLALFVTEWGATAADGGLDGVVCEAPAQDWHDWMNANQISWAAWKLDGGTDSSALFKNRDVPVDGGWDSSDLNGHAPFVIEKLLEGASSPSGTGGTGGTGNNGGTGGGPASSSCQPSGSCAAGDGIDCANGQEVARDCSGCELLACGTGCCSSVASFAGDTYPEFVSRPDLISSFSQSATTASLTASFEGPNQSAAIAFALDASYAIDPYFVVLDASFSGGNLAVSLENGDAGCQYPAFEDSPGLYLLDDLAGNCWGGFTSSSQVAQINVRLDAVSSGSAQLTVRSVSF
jgi:endoglucanase